LQIGINARGTMAGYFLILIIIAKYKAAQAALSKLDKV
jgi:hypothetical protein